MPLTFWIAIVAIACLTIWLCLKWFDRRNRVEVYTPSDANRQIARLNPYFRREVVVRKVKALFPNEDHTKILSLLDTDLPSFWGTERLQLDILKLSNGNLDQLQHYIGVAKSEHRMKVIELAEHPESSRFDVNDKNLFWGEHKQLIEKDFQQYLKSLKLS